MRQGRREFAHRGDSRHMREFIALPLNRQCSLSLLRYVDGGTDPFMHRTVGRNDRHCLNLKMPIAHVTSAYLKLVLVHALFRHCLLPQSLAALSILGVKSLNPTKVAHFIFVLSRELLPTWGQQKTLAFRVCAPDHMCGGHYQRPVPRLAVAQSSLLPSSLLDKRRQKYQGKRNGNQKDL